MCTNRTSSTYLASAQKPKQGNEILHGIQFLIKSEKIDVETSFLTFFLSRCENV